MGRIKLSEMSPEQREKLRAKNLKTGAARQKRRQDHRKMVARYNRFITAQ